MKYKLAIFLLFSVCNSIAQKEATNWYFGEYANINFDGNSIVSTSQNILSTVEGSASVSDSEGNLLFYTNGEKIVNNANQIVATGLLGSYTTTQSALIVPMPGNSSRYYVFTAGPQAGIYSFAPYPGIAYSIYDISLNSGMGGIVTLNQNLISPACEKLTAIQHCNYTDYWVIVHQWNSDAFYAYLITSSGVMTPVISHVGSVHSDVGSNNNMESIGYLKASPDGKKIASAIGSQIDVVEVFDFDNQTGVLSNPFSIPSERPYGISFSEDNSKLYVSTMLNPKLYQYDMNAGSSSDIIASETIVSSSVAGFYALQMGPDKKIYVANSYSFSPSENCLHRINNPNETGTLCNFEFQAVFLAYNTGSAAGLPNFMDAIFENQPSLPSELNVCSFPFILDQKTRNKKYLWSTGDTTAFVTINSEGTYWVEVQMSDCKTIRDSIIIADQTKSITEVQPINVFTPNNDGINDFFDLGTIGISAI